MHNILELMMIKQGPWLFQGTNILLMIWIKWVRLSITWDCDIPSMWQDQVRFWSLTMIKVCNLCKLAELSGLHDLLWASGFLEGYIFWLATWPLLSLHLGLLDIYPFLIKLKPQKFVIHWTWEMTCHPWVLNYRHSIAGYSRSH